MNFRWIATVIVWLSVCMIALFSMLAPLKSDAGIRAITDACVRVLTVGAYGKPMVMWGVPTPGIRWNGTPLNSEISHVFSRPSRGTRWGDIELGANDEKVYVFFGNHGLVTQFIPQVTLFRILDHKISGKLRVFRPSDDLLFVETIEELTGSKRAELMSSFRDQSSWDSYSLAFIRQAGETRAHFKNRVRAGLEEIFSVVRL